MIVKIQKAGSSFKGLGAYLTENKERVAWTHSLNCANDDVLSVIHEMYTSFSQAELLKEQAGVHGGGRELENPVKHISLSWHPSEKPTREEMIEATQSFLKEMGWDEHQALLVAHHDMAHSHVHIMLNRVHPENGLALNERFERVRSQDWALDYEREHGNILCEQRLLDREERTPAPTRETWEKLKESERAFEREEQARREYDPAYLGRDEQRTVIFDHEWQLLKQHQRNEREAFFDEGKETFKQLRHEIYAEVREEFRADWAEAYEVKRTGDLEQFSEMRADILQRQRDVLDERRDTACAELRQERDEVYRDLLLEQKHERHDLTRRQETGLTSPHLLDLAGREPFAPALEEDQRGLEADASGANRAFSAAAQETCERDQSARDVWEDGEEVGVTPAENPRVREGIDSIGGIGLGVLGAIAVIGERLFDGFFGGPVAANQNQASRHEPKPEPQSNAETAREQRMARNADAASRAAGAEQEQEVRRDRDYWRERERGRE